MAGRIRDDDVAAVRERTDIVKLVSGYLTLKRSGADSMSGLCPFHTEKSPSFSVSPSKGVYYCFGCGVSGDAIRFLRELEHLDFAEAVERLARDAGVTLRYEGDTAGARKAASRRQALHDANERAAALYEETLRGAPQAEAARAYLTSRSIDPATAATFGIGFAPGPADFLLKRLPAKGTPAEILVEAGLAIRDQSSGAIRDRFRGRITFPIHDLQGRAIGIGARVLPGDREDGPKYLNSPETPIYRKGETLYNLHRAKGAIARSGDAYVVEGYTDVIALAKAGIDNVVATCGTALGEGHFRLAARFAKRMILVFDGDEAGARAAERAYAHLEAFAVQPVVLVLPEGLDPADLVTTRGGDALRALADEARPVVEYMIRRTIGRIDRSSVEGQAAAVAAAVPLVQGLTDPVRRSEYAHLIADLTSVSEAAVQQAVRRKGAPQAKEFRTTVQRLSAQERVERELLRLLVRDAKVWAELADRLTEEHFVSDEHRERFRELVAAGGDVRASVGAGSDAEAGSDPSAAGLAALAVEPLEGEPSLRYAEDVWRRLQQFVLKRRNVAMRQRLAEMTPGDEGYDRVFQELLATDRELRSLAP